jgi:hypothetical protein
VFKFKQILWHSGLLSTKADPNAGKRAAEYRPDLDLWPIEDRYARLAMREPGPGEEARPEPASGPGRG